MIHSFQKQKKSPDHSGSPMDAALRFLGYRARTAREVERHLDEKQYGEVEVYETVERLKDLGLVDDKLYAENFIRTRLAAKPVSRRRLYEQLLSHEIDRQTIEEALAVVDDACEANSAQAVAEKYARQFELLPRDERIHRIRQRLLSRGYGYDEVDVAIRQCFLEDES